MTPTKSSADVVIVGGGLAGPCLAIQLCRRVPDISIVVVEREHFPVPESAHKVGESSVEIGAHYFNEVLDLSHALIPSKIPKLGLRYFFGADDNQHIEQRPELGQTHYHSVLSTQFDRGRQENILREQCIVNGVEFFDGAKVTDIALHEDAPHEVRYERAGVEREIVTRWVVDASGRRGLLKRKLDLAQSNEHRVNASWWRIDAPLAVDELSTDDTWQRQVPFGMRRLSTNHFMGEGYWLWIIPLASGATSVGIVADPRYHPLSEINTRAAALAWVERHEPQVHALMAPHLSAMQDFRTQKHFSYGATQVFSEQRWALTGEAGVFVDPFYSPGSDFIAMSNGFITELVAADQRGDAIDTLARAYDRQYLALYRSFMLIYEGQYGFFGNPQVMPLKVVWDYTGYWGSTALLYFQNKLHDVAFMKRVTIDVVQVFRLCEVAQRFFRAWHALDDGKRGEPRLMNYHALEYLAQWQALLRHDYDDETLRRALRENRKLMELVLAWMFKRATGSDRDVNPYRMTLEAADIVRPPEQLDMFEALHEYVTARTEIRDGVRTVV